MAGDRYDAVVVGAGPAGSVAATVLARGGARVALVDKAEFPRDKACGDLIGPRGVQVLDDLGVTVPGALRVGDMVVVGPRHRVRLPCRPGRAGVRRRNSNVEEDGCRSGVRRMCSDGIPGADPPLMVT